MKASEVLEQAKWKILEDGWGQGQYVGPLGEMCVAGALETVTGGIVNGTLQPNMSSAPCAAAHTFLAQATGVSYPFDETGSIAEWNDAPERTLTDVLDAFDHAIKLAKEDEALAHAPSTTYQDNSLKVSL